MQTLILLTIALHLISAVYVVRHGHIFPWLFFVLTVPFAGCLSYFAVMQHAALRDGAADATRYIRHLIDPDRALRATRRRAELVGSADAKRALAEECMKRSAYDEAVALLETAAMGVHADDPALLHGLARARFYNNDPAGAQKALDDLRAAHPSWHSPKAHLLYARALETQGQLEAALVEYEALVEHYPGEEARCRMALLLKKQGRAGDARALFQTVAAAGDHAPKPYRAAQRDWIKVARRNLPR